MKNDPTSQDTNLLELARDAAIALAKSTDDDAVLIWNGKQEYRVQSEFDPIAVGFRVILSQEDLKCAFDDEPIDLGANDAASWIIENQDSWFRVVETLALIDGLLPGEWSKISVITVERDGERIVHKTLGRSEAVRRIFKECDERYIDLLHLEQHIRILSPVDCGNKVPVVVVIAF